ncbi:MAG TPA: keto-deoxy-phosphogluconate aldolase [Spongiibacteraceae bacterium]|nr:keto-deoxy-phosphogluconate aldolase [Spongiibacteraceae bacterium]HCS27009.1 keto-deoxy-phosphogluconate aldolase [Spongiibacteraceae bacterium]|tara:strand:- start:401 stop:1021 length:621 start_codon:yes stop_codon:yes gene_type:complete
MDALSLLQHSTPVMPVANFSSDEHATRCAELFAEAGVPAIEVTLRHADAWKHVEICRRLMPECRVGVGTVTNAAGINRASELADFAISPGFDPGLLAFLPAKFTYIPGVSTASEVMQATNAGFSVLKLFPAEAVGGVTLLKALAGPFPDIKFCPTGGISLKNYQDYLALPNVLCVGGSWVIPSLDSLQSERSELLRSLKNLYNNND